MRWYPAGRVISLLGLDVESRPDSSDPSRSGSVENGREEILTSGVAQASTRAAARGNGALAALTVLLVVEVTGGVALVTAPTADALAAFIALKAAALAIVAVALRWRRRVDTFAFPGIAIAFSPDREIPLSDENPEAKVTPIVGVSPASVA